MSILSKTVAAGALALFVVSAGRPLAAQSLAALAKEEEARRSAVKTPAKVITNKDLTPVPVIVDPAAPAGDGQTAAGKSVQPVKEPPKDQAGAKDETKAGDAGSAAAGSAKDQAYWSAQMKALESQLERDQTFSDAMQTRVNSLTADFTNRDDPVQRASISLDRQKALTELSRLKDAIEKDKKSIADFTEEARRAGIPPGWLR